MTQGIAGTGDRSNRVPRWIMAFLIVSLAINFIFIGSVAGAIWALRGPPRAAPNPGLLSYIPTLPAERRKLLWEAASTERMNLRPLRHDARLAREATLMALVADPFDKQAALAAQ